MQNNTASDLQPRFDVVYPSGGDSACANDGGMPDCKAIALFHRHLGDKPMLPEAWIKLAATLKGLNDLLGAEQAYREAARRHPEIAGLYFGLADILRLQERPDIALDCCLAGLERNPSVGQGHVIRAAIYKDLGQAENAIQDLRDVVVAYPQAAAVHGVLSDVLCTFMQFDEAVLTLRHATRLFPNDLPLLDRFVKLLSRQQRSLEEIGAREAMLVLKGPDVAAYTALATLYQSQGQARLAFDTYQKALALEPKSPQVHQALAVLMMGEGQVTLAISLFEMVVTLLPDDATAPYNLGVAYRVKGQIEDAARCFHASIARDATYLAPLLELCHIQQHICAWDGLAARQEALFNASFRQDKPLSPFAVITASPSPADHLQCARVWAAELQKNAGPALSTYAPRADHKKRDRLKIGYVSTDFHNHPTAMLIAEHLEHHDRSQFEVTGYSFGPDDGSALRHRVTQSFETFVDLKGHANAEAARRIHADGIDILINLKGYTQEAKDDVFAHRPAPIQVNYLGYPGTMGGDFMDYMIADAIVAPPDQSDFYHEKLVYLEGCYQPNDRKRAIAERTPNRAELGLPKTGFVFCCFNNSYKITRDMFELWMRLLRRTPGAVLWLLEPNALVATNLRREAIAAGIAPERIVFAARLPADQHLARMRIADLFLDTLPVNAHTTASEALWVGLPVLTCLGDAFTGRVAGSLLQAIGLPDLVTGSVTDYETMALRLAHDPIAMQQLRDRLATNRLDSPLFDTARYTRTFEAALRHMSALRDAERRPEAFAVGSGG